MKITTKHFLLVTLLTLALFVQPGRAHALTSGPLSPGTMATTTITGGTSDWNKNSTVLTSAEITDGVVVQATVGTSSGSPCLEADTTVATPDGDIPIKDIKMGQIVYSYDSVSQSVILKKVIHISNGPISDDADEYYHIYWDGGDIRATYNHTFYVGDTMVLAKDLHVGDELPGLNGVRHAITAIVIETNDTDTVWDLTVEGTHNFFANGVLVHNAGGNVLDNSVQLIKGGTIGSTDEATTSLWGVSLATSTYGGSSDLWGDTWTATDINASNFGVAISAQGSGWNLTNLKTLYLKATNFGFSIPAGATINGINVYVIRSNLGTGCGASAPCANVDSISITVTYTPAAPAPVAPADIRSGLVGYWPFDGKYMTWSSATVGTSTDASGNGNNGTLFNMNVATSTAQGKLGQALTFNGTINNYVQTVGSFSGTASTISSWIYYRGTNPSTEEHIAEYAPLQVWINGSNKLSFYSGSAYTLTSPTIPLNTWVNVVTVCNSVGHFIYINGVLASEANNTSACGAGTGAVRIGEWTGTSLTSFNGSIDDVRLYNRALTATEIQHLYTFGQTGVNKNAAGGLTNNDLNPASGSATSTSGLVGYWPFDGKYTTWTSSTTGTVADASGNGRTGTLTNMNSAISPVQGKLGQAFQFNGTSQYVDVPTSPSLSFEKNQPFSISAWVYMPADFVPTGCWDGITGKNSTFGYMVAVIPRGEHACAGNSIDHEDSIVFEMDITSSNFMWIETPINSFTIGQWQHVVATYDGSNTISGLKVYINGVAKTLLTSGTSLTGTLVNTADLHIGDDGTGDYMKGTIDDLRFYNRTLSAAEVKQLYALGQTTVNKSETGITNGNLNPGALATSTSGLLAYWPFDGKYTTWTSSTTGTVADASGNGRTGTLTNMKLATSPVQGQMGQAFNFNGTNSYITTSNFADDLGNMTVSAWVKSSDKILPPSSYWRFIVGKMSNYINTSGWGLLYGRGVFSFLTQDNSGSRYNQFSTKILLQYSDNRWHHVVATLSGGVAGTITIYVDGVSQTLLNTGSGTVVNDTNSVNVTIGAEADLNVNTLFNGSIDDVRIYNRALSAAEVKQLYDMGK